MQTIHMAFRIINFNQKLIKMTIRSSWSFLYSLLLLIIDFLATQTEGLRLQEMYWNNIKQAQTCIQIRMKLKLICINYLLKDNFDFLKIDTFSLR